MSDFIIEIKLFGDANEDGIKVTNEDIEQKLDKNCPEIERNKVL